METAPDSSDLSENPSGENLDALGSVPILETDNLDETVLGYAAVDDPTLAAPELTGGTEDLTEWDEPALAAGTWTPRTGMDDGTVDAGRLVEAGIEEADRERRLAAGQAED